MSAVLDNIVPFALPKKPRIKEKDAPPDQRKVCIMPIRALTDPKLTDGAVRILALLFCLLPTLSLRIPTQR